VIDTGTDDEMIVVASQLTGAGRLQGAAIAGRLRRVAVDLAEGGQHPDLVGPDAKLPAQLQDLRGAQLAMIFQDPMTALNPVLRIGDQLLEAVNAHAKLSRADARARAIELLTQVGIPAPARRMRDYPFQFSGGMLQRALIAIALASAPRLLLADEPTTSLDVIIQDQILSLLLELQRDTGMSMILVSHDLAVITEVCDRIIVMYAGQVVEEGDAATIITEPRHPYTQALLDALPQAGRRGQLRSIPGAPPSLIDVPAGCRFAARCPLVTDECRSWETELLESGGPGHRARCWRHNEVGKAGAWQASDSA
jgi:oligopeptide/dipeptide ABC transporter ATP-binding protein